MRIIRKTESGRLAPMASQMWAGLRQMIHPFPIPRVRV